MAEDNYDLSKHQLSPITGAFVSAKSIMSKNSTKQYIDGDLDINGLVCQKTQDKMDAECILLSEASDDETDSIFLCPKTQDKMDAECILLSSTPPPSEASDDETDETESTSSSFTYEPYESNEFKQTRQFFDMIHMVHM